MGAEILISGSSRRRSRHRGLVWRGERDRRAAVAWGGRLEVSAYPPLTVCSYATKDDCTQLYLGLVARLPLFVTGERYGERTGW